MYTPSFYINHTWKRSPKLWIKELLAGGRGAGRGSSAMFFSKAMGWAPLPDASGKEKVYRIPYRKGVVILVVAVGLLLSGGG